MYLHMANDFLTFVASYRSGCAIGIENGYQKFVGVWKALGQTRYLERHWRQQEMLFGRLPFQMLEELRRNRTMWRYHDSTGKSELAMDEALELANRFLAQFPKARTLDGFANQGLFIGLAIKSKRLDYLLITGFEYFMVENKNVLWAW